MILSDRDIKKEIKNKNIILKPFRNKNIQPASVDVHLDKEFMFFNVEENYIIDVKKPSKNLMTKVVISKNKPLILHPGSFALGLIYEETGVSDKLVGRLEGKSSLGRLGLIIHTTAGYLDPGNSLKMTLELFNAGSLPIKLYYKMPIAQMAFEYLSSPCEKPYGTDGLNSKYLGDKTVKASDMHKNF
jgi:dCTP deaminase